jgi:hypothetical protein
MFPDCSLVFRKSFEIFDGGKFAHTFTETSAQKQKLSGTDGNRRNIANMLDPKLVVRLEASFGRALFDFIGISSGLDVHEPLLRFARLSDLRTADRMRYRICCAGLIKKRWAPATENRP